MEPDADSSLERERELFLGALEKSSAAERVAYLDGACGDDLHLRRRVESFLKHHRDDGFLENPPMEAAQTRGVTEPLTEKPGDRIGVYKLLQEIGAGGCGVVYMAEQEQPVRRRVALKVVRLGMDTKSVVARFEAERQTLALMDHPNIAKVFDAGATGTGRPFFVMELIRGIKITDYCDQQNLTTAERLGLFILVCHAIQHAHQKGIIHRDIKPSNILVTVNDGVPVPKVIDFGIAKATAQQRLTDKTLFTAFEQFIGTPAYMSPEQAEMTSLDIDTRSDIYALGVLLYELLTGKTPFDAKELLAAGLDEMRRTIRDREPMRPSTRLRTMLEGDRTTTAHRRRTEAPKLIHLLRGDLDWIVMKCLEKDRTRRYETANGLAQDIERHLNHEPVVARPPSTAYKLQKFVRRNKLLMGAAGAVAAALVLGILASLWQAMRATKAEHEQSRLRRQAQAQAYASDMKAAQAAIQQNNRGMAVNLLERHLPKAGQADLRGIEWRFLWQQGKGAESRNFPHANVVNDLAFSPDGRLVATGTSIGKVVDLWDIASETRIGEFHGGGDASSRRCLGFTPDGKRFVFRGKQGVEVRETAGWAVVTNLPCSDDSPLALSRNGRRLVLRNADEMEAWDLETWQCWKQPKLPGEPAAVANIYGLAVSADGTLAAISDWIPGHCWPYVWDIPGNSCWPLATNPPQAACFAFSPDGRWLAAGYDSGEVRLWDPRTRRQVLSWAAHRGWATSLAFSPDSSRLASGGYDLVIDIWEAGTTNRLEQLSGHEGSIECLTFSPDGQQIASGSSDRTARIWDLPMGKSINATNGLTLPINALPIAPSSDGAGLFTADENVKAVSLWSCPSGQLLWTCSGASLQPAEAGSLVYFLKPRLAVGFGTNRVLRIWDMTSGRQLHSVCLPVSSLRPARLSPDQRWLLADVGGVATLFDLPAGRPVPGFEFPYIAFFAADFSADGRLLAISANLSMALRPRVHLWDLKAAKERWSCPCRTTHSSLRFSPDSRLLAGVDCEGGVQLWPAETEKPLWSLPKGHPVWSVTCSFSTDSKTLITSGLDYTLRFWSVAAGQEMLVLPHAFPTISNLTTRSLQLPMFREQTEVNPVPDLLIWQDLERGTRILSLPTFSEIDQTIARRREQLVEVTRRAEGREQQEAREKAVIAAEPSAVKQ